MSSEQSSEKLDRKPLSALERLAMEREKNAKGDKTDELLDAVEKDVASGMNARDAVRKRFGEILPPLLPESERIPVDLELVRAYANEALPADQMQQVCALIWGDDAWGIAYMRIVLEKYPGSRPELLDQYIEPQEEPKPDDGNE